VLDLSSKRKRALTVENLCSCKGSSLGGCCCCDGCGYACRFRDLHRVGEIGGFDAASTGHASTRNQAAARQHPLHFGHSHSTPIFHPTSPLSPHFRHNFSKVLSTIVNVTRALTFEGSPSELLLSGLFPSHRTSEACGGGRSGEDDTRKGAVGGGEGDGEGAASGVDEGWRVVQEVFGGRYALPLLPSSLWLGPALVSAWHKGTCSAAVAAALTPQLVLLSSLPSTSCRFDSLRLNLAGEGEVGREAGEGELGREAGGGHREWEEEEEVWAGVLDSAVVAREIFGVGDAGGGARGGEGDAGGAGGGMLGCVSASVRGVYYTCYI
jgi:hypothetical protein